MKSEQPVDNGKVTKQEKEKSLTEVANHLADIELKMDHLIESIHDSLYRLKSKAKEHKERFP